MFALADFAPVALSVVLLAATLGLTAWLSRRARISPETCRKLVHIGVGLFCLTFPWLFTQTWQAIVSCVVAMGLFALARRRLRTELGAGLHGVARRSWGEFCFALSVLLLFALRDGAAIRMIKPDAIDLGHALYVVPILVLTLSDAAAALIGKRFGKLRFAIADGVKSLEGVAAFAVSAFALSWTALLALTPLSPQAAAEIALCLGLFGALVEAAAWRGLDNLFIPLGLYFLLGNAAQLGGPDWAALSLSAALALAPLIASRHAQAAPHCAASLSALLFCAALYAGPESIIAPVTSFTIFAIAARGLNPSDIVRDSEMLVLAALAIALACFGWAAWSGGDAIFAFNLAFACLAAASAARLRTDGLFIANASVAAWCAMSVRTLWIEGVTEVTSRFAVLGAIVIAGAAWVGCLSRRTPQSAAWTLLAGGSALVGLASLAAAP